MEREVQRRRDIESNYSPFSPQGEATVALPHLDVDDAADPLYARRLGLKTYLEK